MRNRKQRTVNPPIHKINKNSKMPTIKIKQLNSKIIRKKYRWSTNPKLSKVTQVPRVHKTKQIAQLLCLKNLLSLWRKSRSNASLKLLIKLLPIIMKTKMFQNLVRIKTLKCKIKKLRLM